MEKDVAAVGNPLPETAGYERTVRQEKDENDVSLSNRTKNTSELICVSFFICLSLVMGYVALTTKYTANTRRSGIPTMGFPIVLISLILIFSVMQLVRSLIWLKKEGKNARAEGQRIELFRGKSPVVFAAIFLYAWMWRYAGFSVSTLIAYLFISKYLEPERKWRTVLLVSVAFTIGLFLLFGVAFQIPLRDPVANAIEAFIRARVSTGG